MSFFLVGGALALGSTVYKGIQGANQLSKANAIHPLDPGFQVNRNIIDNAKTLADKYNNYVMPGYNNAKNDIDNSFGSTMSLVRGGASSSGDILDSANKLQFGRNKAITDLNVTGAQMKENLLPQVLNAGAAAGNEYVMKNRFDNDRFNQQVNAKAALTQAGQTNLYGALDSAAGLGSAFMSYKTPATGTSGDVKLAPGLFDSGLDVLKNRNVA